MAFEAVTADLRAMVIEALGADQCQKFAFPDIAPNAAMNLWFVRLASIRFASPHRMNAPPSKLVCVAEWVVECLLFQAPADRTSTNDSYQAALNRAESAVFALCAVGHTLGLGPVTFVVNRTDNHYIVRLSFVTEVETNNA